MVATFQITETPQAPDLLGAINQAVMGGGEQAAEVKREDPDVPEERKALVERWQSDIRADKAHFKKVFKRMREDMEYARLGANKEWVDSDKYTVPLINRHINTSVAALYAKNPKAVAKKRRKLPYKLWDGKAETLEAAMMMAQEQKDPMSMQLLQEVEEARIQAQMMQRMGQTLEILFEYFMDENTPTFKEQMKQCVRRAKTCAVAYVDLGFQRIMETDTDIRDQIDDASEKIELIQSKLADLKDDELEEAEGDLEELKSMHRDLQEQEMIIVREGLTFDFPRSTEIIPHKACKQLLGFIGADYITREFHMNPEEVQKKYKVDIRNNYRVYQNRMDTTGVDDSNDPDRKSHDSSEGATMGSMGAGRGGTACVWRVQSRRTGQVFTLIDGYPDFVEEPRTPDLQVNGFYTIFPLLFNPVEDENEIFPLSDVHYLKHPQREYNNARQGLREHRVANRPKYFTRTGAMEEKEKLTLQTAPAHAVIELNALDPATKVEQLIQPYKGVPIDPALYDTSATIRDVMYGVGTQDANLGPTSGATATEVSTAEQSRMSSIDSNVDDLDSFITRIARASGQIMLAHLDQNTVLEVAGPGAVWPELNREEIAKEVLLDVKAGSSGRPNKSAELANMERGMPFLVQLGGVNPATLSNKYADLLDMDSEELIVEGMPSIVALNAMASKAAQAQGAGNKGQVQASTGDASTDPNQQGAEGSNNAAGPGMNEGEPGGQPAYPAIVQYDQQGVRVQ